MHESSAEHAILSSGSVVLWWGGRVVTFVKAKIYSRGVVVRR
jgi:hypothetical protein